MPIDHFCFTVPESKLNELVTFLLTSLAHMGYKELARPIPTVVGIGDNAPFFWISGMPRKESPDEEGQLAVLKTQHIALSAQNVEQVKEFHAAAMKAGATDNGAPGLRSHYGPGYYGAFVYDPVIGLNFEVVYRNAAPDS